MRSFRGSRIRRRNPLDRKVPGVLIRPDRHDEPKPAGYELSSWGTCGHRHCRLTSGVGVALCGKSPGSLVALSRRRIKAVDRPLCSLCGRLMRQRGIEVTG